MTTIRGVMRSYSAAVRSAERTQQKNNRETAKRYKLQQNIDHRQNAIQAEGDYRRYINVLRSVHKDHSKKNDWQQILKIDPPVKPILQTKKVKQAQVDIDSYIPSFFDKLFRLTDKKIAALNQLLQQARYSEESEFDKNLQNYETELAEHTTLQSMAKGVIKKNENAYKEALEYFKPFDDIVELSKELRFKIESDYIEVEMEIMSYDFIPGYELSLTSTGKLSKKNMSTSKYYELFQEHVCSTVIRIAKEISIYFPVNYVLVTVTINELNGATGHRETNTKLSVVIPVSKIHAIALELINPVDCVKSFIHNMKFARTTGFTNVVKIDMENNLLSI